MIIRGRIGLRIRGRIELVGDFVVGRGEMRERRVRFLLGV